MKKLPQYPRILGVSLKNFGFGFSLIEQQGVLANWGTKAFRKNKNERAIASLKEILNHYQPDVLVLADNGRYRSDRIKKLHGCIVQLAKGRNLVVMQFTADQVNRSFFPDGGGNKYALAELLANKFPEELSISLPPPRRSWMPEDARMSIFEAVALALMVRRMKKKAGQI